MQAQKECELNNDHKMLIVVHDTGVPYIDVLWSSLGTDWLSIGVPGCCIE